MLSVFKGFLLPRFYWGCSWQGWRGKYCLKAVKHLFKLGRLHLYLTAYYKHDDEYKEKALSYLKQFVELKKKLVNKHWMIYCESKQDGSYIGLPEDVNRYLRLGIDSFYKVKKSDNVASIGFAPTKQKWFGWSHRAIYGFGVGAVVQDGDCVRSSGWIEGCQKYKEDEKTKPEIGYTTKTLGDCKYLAERFAGAVG